MSDAFRIGPLTLPWRNAYVDAAAPCTQPIRAVCAAARDAPLRASCVGRCCPACGLGEPCACRSFAYDARRTACTCKRGHSRAKRHVYAVTSDCCGSTTNIDGSTSAACAAHCAGRLDEKFGPPSDDSGAKVRVRLFYPFAYTNYASRVIHRKHALTLQLHTAHIISAQGTLDTKNKSLQDIKEQKNKYV